jgi:hypothetical protein
MYIISVYIHVILFHIIYVRTLSIETFSFELWKAWLGVAACSVDDWEFAFLGVAQDLIGFPGPTGIHWSSARTMLV